MGKRKRVAVSTHSELTQYSSLLRSLRTADTANLSSHLLPSHISRRFAISDDSGSNEATGGEPLTSRSEDTPFSTLPTTPLSSQFDPDSAPASPSAIAKTRWTRWPLLSGDVAIPEFSLGQEIERIVNQSIQLRCHSEKKDCDTGQRSKVQSPPDPKHSQEQEAAFHSAVEPSDALTLSGAEGVVSSYLIQALYDGTVKHLSDILGSVAATQPDVRLSMQQKLKPVDWQDILNVATDCGIVDTLIVSRVHARMSSLYSDPQAEMSASTLGDLKRGGPHRNVNKDSCLLQADWYDSKTLPTSKKRPKKGKRGLQIRTSRSQSRVRPEASAPAIIRSSSPSEPLARC